MNRKVSFSNLSILILIVLELFLAGCKKSKDPREAYLGEWTFIAVSNCGTLDFRDGWHYGPKDTLSYTGTIILGTRDHELAIYFPSLPRFEKSDTLYLTLLKDTNGELVPSGGNYNAGHGEISNDSLEIIMSQQGNTVRCSLTITGQKR
jgi:hypothetical protein